MLSTFFTIPSTRYFWIPSIISLAQHLAFIWACFCNLSGYSFDELSYSSIGVSVGKFLQIGSLLKEFSWLISAGFDSFGKAFENLFGYFTGKVFNSLHFLLVNLFGFLSAIFVPFYYKFLRLCSVFSNFYCNLIGNNFEKLFDKLFSKHLIIVITFGNSFFSSLREFILLLHCRLFQKFFSEYPIEFSL